MEIKYKKLHELQEKLNQDLGYRGTLEVSMNFHYNSEKQVLVPAGVVFIPGTFVYRKIDFTSMGAVSSDIKNAVQDYYESTRKTW